MKMLLFHTKGLCIKAGVAGRSENKRREHIAKLKRRLGSALPPLTDSNRQTTADNALLVFVCVEKDDERLNLGKVKEAIVKSRAMIGVTEIVISAFGHLSETPADPILARTVIDDLVDLFVNDAVKNVPFGWDKSLEIKVPLHHYNCAFMSFSAGISRT